MIVGYNHNFRYKGLLFHVQTEDSGVRNPQIVTHLFSGGTVLSTRKTSYADILSSANLEETVRDRMQEQHRDMLRRLREGEFDGLIRERLGVQSGRPEPAPAPPAATPPPPPQLPAATEKSHLDDIVLSYFLGDEGRS